MAYGLVNAPSYFQVFMNDVFRDMVGKFIIVYLDDILVYSNNYSQHVQHISKVLEHLLQYHLYAKAENCEFHKRKVSFLGYNTGPAGVAMEQDKSLGSHYLAGSAEGSRTAMLPGFCKFLSLLY